MPPAGLKNATIEIGTDWQNHPGLVYLPHCYPGTAAKRSPFCTFSWTSFTDDPWERLGAPMPPTRTPQRSGAALHIVKQREEYTLLDNTETKYGQAWRKRLCPGLIGNIPPARCVSARPLAVFPAGPPGPSGGFVRWELFGQSGAQPSPFRTIQTTASLA